MAETRACRKEVEGPPNSVYTDKEKGGERGPREKTGGQGNHRRPGNITAATGGWNHSRRSIDEPTRGPGEKKPLVKKTGDPQGFDESHETWA